MRRPAAPSEDATESPTAGTDETDGASTSEIMDMIEELVEEAGTSGEAVSLHSCLCHIPIDKLPAGTLAQLLFFSASLIASSFLRGSLFSPLPPPLVAQIASQSFSMPRVPDVITWQCLILLILPKDRHANCQAGLQVAEGAEQTGEALKAEVAALSAQLQQNEEVLKASQERYLRLNADFDNYRKRSVSSCGMLCTLVIPM